jgi:hypothetical protein
MAGESIVVFGTTKTLEANGGSIANNSIAQADDATYDQVSDGASFMYADFVASFTFGTAPTEGTVLALYARPLDVDGTGDTEVPEAARPTRFVGSFVVNNVTTLQYAQIQEAIPPKLASYYMHNNATGQTVSAGWTLKVTPRSYKAA